MLHRASESFPCGYRASSNAKVHVPSVRPVFHPSGLLPGLLRHQRPHTHMSYVYAVVILHSSFVVWRTRVCMCYRPPSLACGCSGVCSVCTPLHDACDYGYARLHPIIIVMVLCTLVCTRPALIARANSPTHARCTCCLCSVMHSRSRRRRKALVHNAVIARRLLRARDTGPISFSSGN